jgi:hypothetical protein
MPGTQQQQKIRPKADLRLLTNPILTQTGWMRHNKKRKINALIFARLPQRRKNPVFPSLSTI